MTTICISTAIDLVEPVEEERNNMPPFFPPRPDFNKASHPAGTGINAPLDDEGNTLLHETIRKGELSAVVRLLQLGANPRQVNNQGRSPLFEAVATGDLALVKALADKGAQFRAADDQGVTPLQYAIKSGAGAEFISRLRDLGAELDFQGPSGQGALQAAAAGDNTDVIAWLVKNKVTVDSADNAGKTALHIAVENGAHNAIAHLIEAGADPVARTAELQTPLYLAAARGDEKALEILLAVPEVQRTLNEYQSYREGFTALLAAVAANHIGVAARLIDLGANVNSADHQSRHSLAIAVERGFPQMVDLLIRKGADIEKAPQAYGAQPLIHRINNNAHYSEILLALFSGGADLNAQDSSGTTALSKASDLREVQKVKALLELGADPDLPNNYGRRPIDVIMAIAASGYYGPLPEVVQVVRLLLTAGADTNLAASSSVQSAPLHQAARASRGGDLVRLLLASGAIVDAPERGSGQTAWQIAVLAGNTDACQLLKESGADTARKDNQMRSVLHLAAQSGAADLLKAGLKDPRLAKEVSVPDNLGNTPLHFATRYQKTDCVTTLLAAGANPLAADSSGLTPLHMAATHYSDTVFSVFETALGVKANWNIQSRDSKETPLHLAAKGGYQNIVARLLKLNVNVTLRDNRGFTPLHGAVAGNQAGPTTALIDHMRLKKLSLDERDNNGQTPLHIAAQSYTSVCLAQLLNAGADVNARTPAGDAPLHIAVRSIRLDSVKALIQKGADVTAANKLGATPLDIALEIGRQDIAALLTQAAKDQQMKAGPQQPQQKPQVKKASGFLTPPKRRRPPAPGP